MLRLTRIGYERAFHPVMNRGRNKQAIFHDESYFKEIKTPLITGTDKTVNSDDLWKANL